MVMKRLTVVQSRPICRHPKTWNPEGLRCYRLLHGRATGVKISHSTPPKSINYYDKTLKFHFQAYHWPVMYPDVVERFESLFLGNLDILIIRLDT